MEVSENTKNYQQNQNIFMYFNLIFMNLCITKKSVCRRLTETKIARGIGKIKDESVTMQCNETGMLINIFIDLHLHFV